MIVYRVWSGRIWGICSNMIVYVIVHGRMCSNMVRYDRVCDLICDRFSVVQRFSCSEFQRFQVFQGFQGFQVSKVPLPQCWVNVGQLESVCSWGYVCRVEKVLVDQHCKCWSDWICLLPGYGSRWILLNNTKSLLRPRPTLASQSGPNQAHIAMPGSPCRQI